MMMKVQCDSCGTRYKLDESRIKGKGARITCPKCGHTFVVYRNPTDFDDEEPATIVADRAMLFSKGAASEAKLGVGSGTGGAKLASGASAAPSSPWEDEGSATIVDTPGMASTANGLSGRPTAARGGTSSVARPTSVDTLNWREVGVTAFKVKISIGLVYDFSDVPLLKKYLADNKVARTDLLSFDGKEWTPINTLGDLDTYFIDKWVSLKKASVGEAPGSAPAPGRMPGASSAFVPAASSPKAPRTDPVSVDTLFSGADSSPVARPQATSGTGASKPAPAMDGGLQGDMLFGGMPVPEGPTHAPAPLHRPASTSSDASRKPKTPRPPPPQKAAPMGKGQIAALVVLVGLAGLLGWFYQQGAAAASALGESQTLVDADNASLERSVHSLYPTIYGKTSAPEDNAGALPEEAPSGEEEAAKQKDEGAASALAQAPAPKASVTRPKAATAKKASPGVQVSAISAVDLVELGDAQFSGADYNGAMASYAQAVALAPKNGSYLVKLGSAQLRAGNHKAAAQSLEKGLKLAPKEVDGHKRLGEALEAVGRNQDARASYERYLKARPNARDRADIEARIARLS